MGLEIDEEVEREMLYAAGDRWGGVVREMRGGRRGKWDELCVEADLSVRKRNEEDQSQLGVRTERREHTKLTSGPDLNGEICFLRLFRLPNHF